MTEEEVDLHRGLLQEKKPKKTKKSKSETLAFNRSAMHTDLVPEQLDWRDYGTKTNILGHLNVNVLLANTQVDILVFVNLCNSFYLRHH